MCMEIKYYLGEIWRDIAGYEGLYQVSNLGRVKSLPRKTGNQYSGEEKIKPQYERKGGIKYLYVNICKEGKGHSINVHKLVAHAFPEICGEYFE